MPIDRSVWGVETDAFKTAFRDYLLSLQDDDDDRDNLIQKVLWCVDVWDQHRREYFPNERCERPLLFPFFEAQGQAGSNEKPAAYKLFGSQGQPSVIAIRHNLLMATSDLTIWKSGDGERRLVLKKDHILRTRYIERLIVHQLLQQFLVESAPEGIRREYTHQTSSGAAALRQPCPAPKECLLDAFELLDGLHDHDTSVECFVQHPLLLHPRYSVPYSQAQLGHHH